MYQYFTLSMKGKDGKMKKDLTNGEESNESNSCRIASL